MTFQALSSIQKVLGNPRIVAWATVLAITSVGDARQDNPFSTNTPANPASPQSLDEVVLPEIDPSLAESVKLIIRSVRESNPSTPTDLARAIKTMLNIEQYDEAKYYLNRLVKSGADASQIFVMYQRMGSDFFFQLHSESNLLPQGRQFARTVFETVRREALSPARIDGLIKQLSDENADLRADAYGKLKRLGAAAAAAMLNTVNEPSRDSEFRYIQTALANMDEGSLMPLLGAARADATAAQLAAVRALGNIHHPLAVDTLYRAYLSARVPAPTREIAFQSLAAQTRRILTANEAEDHLYQRALQYLQGKQSLPHSADNLVSTWHWDASARKLLERKVDQRTALRMMAKDLASDLYELNSLSARNRHFYLISVLESAKRLAGPDQKIDFVTIKQSLSDVNAEDINAALATAMSLDLVPAAVGAAEVLEEIGTTQLLSTSDNRASSLVSALVYGERHLQYAAARAIARIDPQNAYVGSSYMMKTAAFLASSRGTSIGLVGDLRPEFAQSYAAAIAPTGMTGRSVNSSRELFDLAISDADVDVILVTDSLSDPHYLELVQQIRSDWRTKRVPIGLLIRDIQRTIRAEATLSQDPLLIIMPVTVEASKIYQQIERLRSLREPWPVTDVQRRAQTDFAIDWLTKIVTNRQKYRFYDLMSYQAYLVKSFSESGAIAATSELLASLGTPSSQRALADFASEAGAAIDQRKIAADAFNRSVKSHGTLLTTTEIQLQYDRFNASHTRSKESQAVLASILDSIEMHVKSTE